MLPVNEDIIDHFLGVFDTFVDRHLTGDIRDLSLIELKRDHTKRVLQNSASISGQVLSENPALYTCAVITALFHDIGRFPQYLQYRTFNDRLSTDHGRLGVDALKSEKILDALPKQQRKLILAGVSLHNKKSLPPNIPHELKIVCDIVRDSDKLDIFTVMLDHFATKTVDKTITLELTEHPTNYSPAFFEKVLNNQECSYTEMRWTNDFKLMLAHWIYHLNFPVSYALFEQQDSFRKLFQLLPDDSRMQLLKQTLAGVLAEKKAGMNHLTA